jgi:hypothetical protein
MHKIVAAAAVLGLLGLPILASAQNTNQPSTKKESAANAGIATKKATKGERHNQSCEEKQHESSSTGFKEKAARSAWSQDASCYSKAWQAPCEVT